MFANAEAAMPPQLAVANVSVIDPITAEASLQSTTAEFYAGASIDKGLSYVSCVDPLDGVDLESSLVVENDMWAAQEAFTSWPLWARSPTCWWTMYFTLGMACVILWNPLLWSCRLPKPLTFSIKFNLPAGIEQGELAIYIGYELVSDLNKPL